MHVFVADVGLLSVLQGFQFDLKKAYLAYHCSPELDWEDKALVGWFRHDRASGIALDIPACKSTTNKRTVSDVHVMKWVGVVSVVVKTGHQKTSVEGADAVSSVVVSSAYFSDPFSDVPILEVEGVADNSP